MSAKKVTDVFPTRVGMNRSTLKPVMALRSVPHASGDEPWVYAMYLLVTSVFPTRVGMNRPCQEGREDAACVPHASGDEPNQQRNSTY